MGATVEVAWRADDELAAAMARLLPQLSSSSAAPDRQELRRIVEFRLYRRLGFQERPSRVYRHTGPTP